MKKFLLLLLLFPTPAFAQASVSCNAGLGETAVLSSFADNVPGGITPRNLRDYVCSNAAGSIPFTGATVGTGQSVWPQFDTAFTVPSTFTVLQGSLASPTTSDTPTSGVSRSEAINIINTPGGYNAAFYAASVGNNTSDVTHNAQTVALTGKAEQNGTGDAVGGFFIGVENGAPTAGTTHTGFGLFAQAYGFHNPSNAFGAEIGVNNSTGVDWTLANSSVTGYGVALHLGPSGQNLISEAIWVTGAIGGGNNSQFDAGIKFDTNSVKTTVIDVVTNAVNGLDFSASTLSGSLLKGAGGLNILGTGHFGWNPQFDFQGGTGAGMWLGDLGTHTGQQIFVGSDSSTSNTFRVFFGGVGGSNTNVLVALGTSVSQLVTVNGNLTSTLTITGSQFASNATNGVSCAAGTTSAATLVITGGIVTHC